MFQAQITGTWGFWLLWGLAFLAFPIGGLAATVFVGPVTTTHGGTLAGAVIGFIQWLVLKGQMPLPGTWTLATCIGMALGLGISVAFLGSEMNGTTLLWVQPLPAYASVLRSGWCSDKSGPSPRFGSWSFVSAGLWDGSSPAP